MLSRDPTFLGKVAAVSGAALNVHLAPSVGSGLSVINGQTYRVGQVGSFVRIPQGYQDLFGVVSEVGATAVPESVRRPEEDTGRWMKVQLVGEAIAGSFERGISQYPNISDSVRCRGRSSADLQHQRPRPRHSRRPFKRGKHPCEDRPQRVGHAALRSARIDWIGQVDHRRQSSAFPYGAA